MKRRSVLALLVSVYYLGIAGTSQAQDALQVQIEWQCVVVGEDIGKAGIQIVDLENDGVPEILVNAYVYHPEYESYWYVLGRTANGYEVIWTSPIYSAVISCLRAFDVNQDGHPDILAAAGNQIYIYDGLNHQLLQTITTSAGTIKGLNVADIDADGQLEAIFCVGSALFIYDIQTGVQEYRGDGYGSSDLAIGDVDGDGTLEIVLAGTPGRVLDGQTRAVEWSYAAGFGSVVRLANVDDDPLPELVTAYASTTKRISVFDLDTQTVKYNLNTSRTIDALAVADVEGDGGPQEILYGDSLFLHVCSGATGAQKWQIANPGSTISSIAVGDVDGDGINELVWGDNPSVGGNLYVYDSQTRTQEWRSLDIFGPFYAQDFGDVDQDGRPELLYSCNNSESGSDKGLWFVYDAITKDLEYQSPPVGPRGIRHANVDADPQAEIVTIAGNQVVCYDGLTHAEQWRLSLTLNQQSLLALEIADVDHDGQLEVVATTTAYIYVLDAATGTVKWRSVLLGTYGGGLNYLRIANIDEDPDWEIVCAEDDGQVFAYDGTTHLLELQTPDLAVTGLDTVDLDGDGIEEIIVSTSAGTIQRLDPVTGFLVQPPLWTESGRIDGLLVRDVAGGPSPELIYCLDGEPYIRLLSGQLVWRGGERLGRNAGQYDSLMLADIDGDGHQELVVNMGIRGLRIYEIRRPVYRAGDLNCNGVVDFFDVDPFILALLDPAAYEQQFPSCLYENGDVNRDGTVDFFDIDPFVGCVLNGGC